MDRYSIEKQLQKALSHVRGLKEVGTDFYSAGRKGWSSIIDLSLLLAKEATDMLQLGQLDDTNPDFNADNQDYVTRDVVQQIVRETLKISGAPSVEASTGQSPEKLVQDYIRMPKPDVIRISKNYNRILERLAKTDCGSDVVNQCADVLWRWYEARFIKTYTHVPVFHYDICRIKSVIYYMVTILGYHHELGDFDIFIQDFNKWVRDLGISPKSHTWIAPHEVYEAEKGMEKVYANLSAVVIWDVLLDKGLMELCKMTPHNAVYPRDNQLWDIMESVNVDVLDPYINYKEDATILVKLKLIGEGGSISG